MRSGYRGGRYTTHNENMINEISTIICGYYSDTTIIIHTTMNIYTMNIYYDYCMYACRCGVPHANDDTGKYIQI